MPRRSLVLADDHELVARSLATMLAPYHDVVGIAHSGAELVKLLERTPAEGVLLDLSMPVQSGLDVLPRLRDRWPTLKILILTMHADRTLADTSLGLGAHGYVPKDASTDELLRAIEAVFAGQQFVSSYVPKHSEHTGLHALHPALASLTPREEQILLMLGEGRSSARIARLLDVSKNTITFHRANLRRKLGVKTELGLHQFAVLMYVTLGHRVRARTRRPRPG